jgi:beta-mannosidase
VLEATIDDEHVEATLRRGAGTIPWQFDEPYPNAWCTCAVDYRGDPKPAYWGVAQAYAPDAVSARFVTPAWGGLGVAQATVTCPARFVELDGTVVAESDGGELSAALDAFTGDVFLLDVGPGRNRYVMTRTESLAPLLDLPEARLELVARSNSLVLSHVSGPAALGVVLEDARPYEAPGWVTFSENVLDLLPGEERTIELAGPVGELRAEGWNARA